MFTGICVQEIQEELLLPCLLVASTVENLFTKLLSFWLSSLKFSVLFFVAFFLHLQVVN